MENAAYTFYPGDPTAGSSDYGEFCSTLQSAVGDQEGNVAPTTVESLTATVMENVTATAENETMA